MKTACSRSAGVLHLAFLVLAFLLPAAPLHAQELKACVNGGNGGLRLVGGPNACHNNETFGTWNGLGPAGPPGPAGPEGPAGSSTSGPPYVWICTPAHYPMAGSNVRADLYVFNGGGTTANVAVNI